MSGIEWPFQAPSQLHQYEYRVTSVPSTSLCFTHDFTNRTSIALTKQLASNLIQKKELCK